VLEYIKLNCSVCAKEYQYHHKDTKSHTKTKCGSCLVNQRRLVLKQKCVEYKGGKCERCNYNKSLRALTFHHIDPKEKDFSISGNHCRSFESVKKELDKCILLCANCHAEEHERIDRSS
jgi:hypothetical protein